MSNDENNNGDKQNDWVHIISNDGFSFIVRRKVASTSSTLKNMLNADSNFSEAVTGDCHIDERGAIVEKLCEYMAFKSYYGTADPKEDLPVGEFQDRIPPEVALELLEAADFLEV